MEQASPARLFATLAGAGLLVYGVAGFFFDSSFARPEDASEAIGLLAVNGWANTFHMLTGATGLLLAGFAPRPYAISLTATYAAIALA
jgi:hypothetical protein